MHLEWSQFANADREAIFDYIEADSPQAAIAVDDRIQQQIEELMKFPKIGRPGRIDGTRELIIQRTPYIAVYRIAGKTIRILRLLHGAQMWP
jgi:toxin ParE1/3/4